MQRTNVSHIYWRTTCAQFVKNLFVITLKVRLQRFNIFLFSVCGLSTTENSSSPAQFFVCNVFCSCFSPLIIFCAKMECNNSNWFFCQFDMFLMNMWYKSQPIHCKPIALWASDSLVHKRRLYSECVYQHFLNFTLKAVCSVHVVWTTDLITEQWRECFMSHLLGLCSVYEW